MIVILTIKKEKGGYHFP